MSKKHSTAKLWIYIKECVRLLYWMYFKPYTLKSWLHDIYPELKPTDDPFKKRTEFRTNPRLYRYTRQVLWLTTILPILLVLGVAPIYIVAGADRLNLSLICMFLLGWLIGMLTRYGNIPIRVTIFCFIIFLTIFMLSKCGVRVPERLMFNIMYGIITSMIVNVVGGVTVGVAVGIAFAVMGVMGGSVPVGIVVGAIIGIAFGVSFRVLVGIVVGIAFGVVVGILSGITVDIPFSVAWILGVLRVYFWFPELLWTITLFFISRLGKPINYLRYLPPRFDELIILPLPFIGQMIVESYQDNPIATRETIDYLMSFTNQQKVATQAMSKIPVG